MILADPEPRIGVVGQSGSGKSTSVAMIERGRCLTPVDLDHLCRLPNTARQARPSEELLTLHDEAIRGAGWVTEGCSRCLPQRLAGAGFVLPDGPVATSLLRCVRRP